MMLRDLNSTTGGSHRQRLWVPLLIAFVAMCAFLLPLAYPGRAETHPATDVVAAAPVSTLANLEVSQTGPQTVFAGDKITYTIVVVNNGSSTVNDVTLFDTWTTKMYQSISTFWPYGVLAMYEDYHVDPPGAVVSFAHQVNDTYRRGEATWQLSPIIAGGSVEIVFTVTVPITLQPTLDNYIAAPLPSTLRRLGPSTVENSIFASVGLENFPANISTAQVVAPLLLLTQSAQGEYAPLNQARVGRLLTYTVQIENVLKEGILQRPDGWPATNLVITEVLPVEVQSGFISAVASDPNATMTYSEAIGTLVWKFEPTYVLTRGEKTHVTYTVRVPANLAYNPPTKYLITNGVPTGDLRAQAALMPFRVASLRSQHRVTLISPFDKTVATLSPPIAANSTFANRPITYTLTFYNPVSTTVEMELQDTLHNTFIFSHTASGDLPTPLVNGPQLTWENVTVPGYGMISTTFVVTVTPETLVTDGGTACRNASYYNAVAATAPEFPTGIYIGHNNNRLAEVRVEPQLKVSKTVLPTSQLPGQEVIYKITVQNVGDTLIPAPIVITDTLPASFAFVRMAEAPPPGDPVVNGNVLVWNDIPALSPGANFVFSFVAEVDGLANDKVKNLVVADSLETPFCAIESAQVTILSPFDIKKSAQSWTGETVIISRQPYPLVRQGDPVTYTPSIYNIAPRTTYTLTQFRDILDKASVTNRDRTGLVTPFDGGLEYIYTLPAPFTLYPEGSWEHVFTATMRGFGIGDGLAWCNDKERISNAKVEQLPGKVGEYPGYVQFIMQSGVASNLDALAPIYIVPHVSMFQQAYPNPVAIGEMVTVVLTLRDNRTNPITPVTGINLQWNLPNTDFKFVDTSPMTTSSNASSAFWNNVELPVGGERVFLIRVLAPFVKQDGWERSYNATAQVNSLDDMNSICIPRATSFIKSASNIVGPDHTLGLPGPLPEFSDQSFVQLKVVQGIELNKIANPKQIGPYGTVDYEIIVKNLTGAPVPSIVITDILPYYETSPWVYLETIDGVEPHGEDPLYWNIGTIEALSEMKVVIKVRSSSWVGLAINQLTGSGPINIGYHKDYNKNMEVMAVSGIGFYKVAEPTSILAGEATTYTIRVYNGAIYDIQNVVVTDTLPLGFSFEEMVSPPTLQPIIDGQQLQWTIPSIAKNGGVATIVFRARTATEAEGMFTGKYYNDIIATAQQVSGDPVEVPPTGPTAPVYVDGLPTVEVHKTATPQTVVQGQDVVYQITLHNEAETGRTLQITDTLPTHFTLVELIDPTQATTSYVGDQQQIIWHDIPIGGQSWVTLTFRARADDQAPPGRYGNVVQVQIDAFALPPSQPMANVWIVELPRTDAKISKTDGSLVAEKGATINYTIVYTNASPDAIAFETIILTETISPPPPYITVLSAGWEDRGNGQFRRVIDTPLNPGASNTLQFSIQLAENVPDEFQWLHNQVEIGYTTAEQTIESTPKDNVAEDWNLISGGESIVALKQADYAGDILLAGQEVTYTISILNTETQAHTLRITDTLPVSFTFSAPVSPPNIEMTQFVNGHWQVVWDGIDAPAQAFTSVVFRARINPLAGAATACNIVQMERGDGLVLPETDPQACVEVQPLQRVDAYVNKSDGVDSAQPGDALYYSIQYGNAATSEYALATIVLTETVSPPEVIGSVIAPGWQAIGNGQYRITLDGLPPGGTGETLFAIRLSSAIPTNISAVHNQVEIGFTTVEPSVEVNLFNNIGTDVTIIQHDPNDVIASKSAALSINPARPGDLVTYTINLRNNTSNVYTSRITDTLPSYFSFAQAVYPTTGVTPLWDGGQQLVVWETSIPPGTTSLIFRAQIASNAPSNRYYNAVQVQRNATVQPKVTSLAPVDVVSGLKVVDAQVSKSDGRTSVMAGEILTYTITYANAATSELRFETVTLIETISPIDYLTVLNTHEWEHQGGGRYTRVLPGPLTPGESPRNVQFIVQLSNELPDTVTEIVNTVEIDYTTSEPVTEPDVANNTYTDITRVGSPVPPGSKIYLPLVLRKR